MQREFLARESFPPPRVRAMPICTRVLDPKLRFSLALFASFAFAPVAFAGSESRGDRPNIVIMMADDMGYSDIGCYGGEIETPTIDALAANGLRFTQFYNTARCCPTRASLLTGLYPHQAGVGWMMQDSGYDGYRGELNRRSVTIAEVLRAAGYATYMSGKWHVTKDTRPDGDKSNWPIQRGFDRFFGTIHGAGSFFDPNSLTRDNTQIAPESDDFYYTDAISDHAAKYIREHAERARDKPFFLYVPYTAPHWPMHALPDDIAKYRGRYAKGWDELRRERHERMIAMGIVEKEWTRTPRDPQAPAWVDAKDKPWFERRMEVYAAMVDRMDQGIAHIVKALRETGVFENTLVLFLADNGGCAEEYGSRGSERPDPARKVERKPMRPGELQTRMQPTHTRDGRPVRTGYGVMPGPADTYIAYGLPWANASNTPFRRYKHWVHEGGIATPLVVHWPRGLARRGELEHQPGHLIDLMATCVDVAGAEYPKSYRGQEIQPLEGRSLRPAFSGETIEREALYWEHEGNRAVRVGDWKLVARGEAGPWELYYLAADRTELMDLSRARPKLAAELAARWDAWAKRAHVYPLVPYYKKREKRADFSRKRRFELKAGERLARAEAPYVAEQSVHIVAELSRPGEGVIVAQGGPSDGWALFVRKGKLAFATRHRGTLAVVEGQTTLVANSRVTASLAKDGAIAIAVDGQTVAKGTSPGAMARMPIDGLEVGSDEGGAVGPYAPPNPFTGAIDRVEIRVKKN